MDSNANKRITNAVIQLKDGEMQAFDELYALTHDKVYFLALKMLHNEEDALEIVQETYLSVYRSIGKLYNPQVFNTWLSKIVVNKCRDFLGKNKEVLFSEAQTDGEDDYEITDTIEETDSTVIPHEVLDSAETRNMVMALIDKLPVAQRTTLLLYYYQQLSVDEVAAVMDCPVATVKSRLQYARKQVKKGVEGYEAQGVKLYSIAAAPLILFALEETAKHSGLGAEAALQIYTAVKSTTMSNAAASANSAASESTALHPNSSSLHTVTNNSSGVHKPPDQGHAPSVSKSGLVKKAAHFSLRAKIIAGVAAAAVAITGAGIAVSHMVPGFSVGQTAKQKNSSISIRISNTFKTPYTTPDIGTFGNASYERPFFKGTPASVSTMNTFFAGLEQKWSSDNQESVKNAVYFLNTQLQQGGWTYNPDTDKYMNEVTCKAAYNQNGLISIVMEQKTNMPGNGHGADNLFSYTFDAGSGKQLTLSDVLNSATKDNAIIQTFEKQDAKDFSSGDDNDIKLRNNPEAVNFYLDSKGVSLYLNANQQAAAASDTITVTIPYTSSFISVRLKPSD